MVVHKPISAGSTRVIACVIRLIGGVSLVGIVWIGLSACGNSDAVDETSATSMPTRTLAAPTATLTSLPVMTTPTPTDLPAPVSFSASSVPIDAGSVIPESAQPLINAIADDILTDRTIEPGDLRLVSLERFIWHDAAWGCNARRGQGYTEDETVPGYRIIFTVGARAYVYHSDRLETFFLCSDRDWLALHGEALPLDPIAESMVTMSARDAAKRLAVTEDDLVLVGLLVISWLDSSVGCPQPGIEYQPQETAGYRVVFGIGNETSSETVIYHTSLHHVVRCDPDEEILPGWLRRALAAPNPTLTPAPST